MHQPLTGHPSDTTAHAIEPRLGHVKGRGVRRQRPVRFEVGFDFQIEAVKQHQLVMPCMLRFEGVGRKPKQADKQQPRQGRQRHVTPFTLGSKLRPQLIEKPLNAGNLMAGLRADVAGGNANGRNLPNTAKVRALIKQRPYQLLAHRQHMAIAALFGGERMGNSGRRQKEHRPLLMILPVIQVNPDHAAVDVVHLKKAVMVVNRHVAPEEVSHRPEGIVMHRRVSIPLIVLLTDRDIGNGGQRHVSAPGWARLNPKRCSYINKLTRLLSMATSHPLEIATRISSATPH